jgi:predicted acylesterase/phospholipase RssA
MSKELLALANRPGGLHGLRIGLALSGGGFRATLFHLGVVRFLSDIGLLGNVTDVCAVSGGSILAAHLGSRWANYLPGEASFDGIARDLIELIENGVREKVVHRLPLYYVLSWLPRCGRFNATWVLRGQYESLYKRVGLVAISQSTVRIHLLATNLTIPGAAFCFSANGCEHHPSDGRAHFGPGSFKLARAVAASSAFPGLFPPLEVRHNEVGANQLEFGCARAFLTDGGVFDNLAVRALRELHNRRPFDLRIISDAGAMLDAKFETNYLRAWNYVPRIVDIMGERVCALEREEAPPDECHLSIHTLTSPSCVHTAIQQLLGGVRTDLDAFPNIVARSLVCHGYAVAKKQVLSKLADIGAAVVAAHGAGPPADGASAPWWVALQNLVAEVTPWEPYSPAPSTGSIAGDVAIVDEARQRRLKLVDFTNDIPALVVYILVLVLLIVGMWFVVPSVWSGVSHRIRDAVLHPNRGEYPKDKIINLSAEIANLSKEIYPNSDPKDPGSIERAGRAVGWQLLAQQLATHAAQAPERRKVYVVKQDIPFRGNYQQFFGQFRYKVEGVNPKIIDGIVFLRREIADGTDTPNYRQLSFRRDDEGKIVDNLINIDDPNDGESLWMLILVEGNQLPSAGAGLKGFLVQRY